MKKLIPVLLASVTSIAAASDTAIFSSEEYCDLVESATSLADKNFNRAYVKKLGEKPTRDLCKSIKADQKVLIVSEDDKWDFHQNKLSRESAIRLSNRQIALLKSRNVKPKDVF